MKMQGYNGSQLWDTSFAVQAIAATGMAAEFSECLQRAAAYIDASQVQTESPQPLARWYRHISKGAWPFSNQDHGWPISDCTSEGLKVGGCVLWVYAHDFMHAPRMASTMTLHVHHARAGCSGAAATGGKHCRAALTCCATVRGRPRDSVLSKPLGRVGNL